MRKLYMFAFKCFQVIMKVSEFSLHCRKIWRPWRFLAAFRITIKLDWINLHKEQVQNLCFSCLIWSWENTFSKFQGTLFCLRHFWQKMIENAFSFTLKVLFVLKIFTFLAWLFAHLGKWLDWQGKINFNIYDVTTLETSNWSKHIVAQYLKK